MGPRGSEMLGQFLEHRLDGPALAIQLGHFAGVRLAGGQVGEQPNVRLFVACRLVESQRDQPQPQGLAAVGEPSWRG